MNGWLVTLHHTMDDFPMGVFATKAEAVTSAAEIGWTAPSYSDASTPVCISIQEFVDGKFDGRGEVLRRWEAPSDEAIAT